MLHWAAHSSSRGSALKAFICSGYENLNLDGDGFNGFYDAPVESDKTRREWLIGGGFSIKF